MTIHIPTWTLVGAAILLVAAAFFFIGRASVDDEPEPEGANQPAARSTGEGLQECETIELGTSSRGEEYLAISAAGVDCEEAERIGREIAEADEFTPPPGYECTGNTRLTCVSVDGRIVFGFGYR